ncbi:MAG: phosphodiester glycosidase family protein [Sulfurovaceae bacterium]
MNGGMYEQDLSPQGLYIEQGKMFKTVNRTQEAYGNFYMQPIGVFCITKSGKASVVPTKDFVYKEDINYATQSGPMLVIDGKLHHRFMPDSKNVYIRNGVGILPNGDLLFAISKEKINFYNFATYFKKQGCKDALYLDGFVSRIYLPSKGLMQYDSIFGVIIAEVSDTKN